ncbi:FitA-like ribbon-helix-helix domain-containing protein [Nocardia sp. R16R-3T]
MDLRPRPMVIGYHSSDADINDIIDCMASITIRDLDDTVKERLRRRAAAHGRSMEAEARAILSDSVRPTNILRDIYDATRELPDGPDLDIPEQEPARVIEL